MLKRMVAVFACAVLAPCCQLAWAGGYGYGHVVVPCGGCADPCPRPVCVSNPCPPSQMIDEAQDAFQIVMVPKYDTEIRTVVVPAFRDDPRLKAVPIPGTVPVIEDRVRTKMITETTTEKVEIEYTVMEPVITDHVLDYKVTVPVWNDGEDTYVIKVPVIKEVPEEYCVLVPVLKDVEFKYPVCVPHGEKTIRNRQVTNAIPVVKTKIVPQQVPVNKVARVTRDFGYWEERIVDVPCHTGGYHAGCGGCGGMSCHGCAVVSRPVCQRVWVPVCVTEDLPLVVTGTQPQELNYIVYEHKIDNVPYECTRIVFQTEWRTAVKKEVSYITEKRMRTKKVVEYVDEPRKRPTKTLSFQEIPKQEMYKTVSYVAKPMKKIVEYPVHTPKQIVEPYTVTRHDRAVDFKLEPFTVKVPIPATREVTVQVCRMVPTLVPVKIRPCADCAPVACPTPCASCGPVYVRPCCR